MARRRSDRYSYTPPNRRYVAPLPRVVLRPIVVVRHPPVNLDMRTFHPMGRLRPRPALPVAARRLVPSQPKRYSAASISHKMGFAVPKRVLVCVRRKQRREVIHAKRLTRKGAGSPKRRNIWSAISC